MSRTPSNQSFTQLMNKQILSNNEVMNMITTQLIGPESEDQYYPIVTDWTNDSKPSVLYTPKDTGVLSPLLIAVEHMVDDSCLHRVVKHCEKINDRYGAVPMVLVFAISKIHCNVMRRATKVEGSSFLVEIHSFPWAKTCMFMNNVSIREHLNDKPLAPLVAIGSFLIAQVPSIANHGQRYDPIVQRLYAIAREIPDNKVSNEEGIMCDLLSLCNSVESKIKRTLEILNDVPGPASKRRAIDYLNDSIEIVKTHKHKYIQHSTTVSSASLDELSTSSSSSAHSRASSSSSSSTPIASGPPPTPVARLEGHKARLKNWEYVDQYVARTSDQRMNWKACYEDGLSSGFFHNYVNHFSLKSAYQRWKANHE